MKVAVDTLARWRRDPVAFARECVLFDPEPFQHDFLSALVKQDRMALKASKGPGKTAGLAIAVLWFLALHPHAKVVCTSITGDNLRDGLWTELSIWQKRSPFLSQAFEWSTERFSSREHPETWWASARTWPKSGDPSAQANTLAGVHADSLMFVIDEAGGIPDAVVAAAEAGLANASKEHGRTAKMVLAGNPTHTSGPLWRACTKERALWWVKEITSDPDDPNRAQRVSVTWARQQIEKFGRESAWVRVNVFGEFPPSSSNGAIPLADVEAARARKLQRDAWTWAPRLLGLDVARFGDDRSVLFGRQGLQAFRPRVWRGLRANELVGQVSLVCNAWEPDAIFVDTVGVGGGTADILVDLGYPVIEVNASGKSPASRYGNLRAYCYAELAEWMQKGSLPDDPDLVAELVAPEYRFRSDGALMLEEKDLIKKKLGRSPDLSDALALTFAQAVATRTLEERAQRRVENGPGLATTTKASRWDYDPLEREG